MEEIIQAPPDRHYLWILVISTGFVKLLVLIFALARGVTMVRRAISKGAEPDTQESLTDADLEDLTDTNERGWEEGRK